MGGRGWHPETSAIEKRQAPANIEGCLAKDASTVHCLSSTFKCNTSGPDRLWCGASAQHPDPCVRPPCSERPLSCRHGANPGGGSRPVSPSAAAHTPGPLAVAFCQNTAAPSFSPKQIAGRLRREVPRRQAETLSVALYVLPRGALRQACKARRLRTQGATQPPSSWSNLAPFGVPHPVQASQPAWDM